MSTGVPSTCRNGAAFATSCERMVSEAEYQRLSAKKIDQVPSVTMKGGSLSRVTSTPLTAPQPPPAAMPISSASGTGRPAVTASLPMITEHSTMMAPTDRSMPAVITISVWATPITPMIVTCWMISDRLNEERKRGPTMRPKAAMPSNSTIAGTAVGLAWRKCCSLRSGDLARTSNSATRCSLLSNGASRAGMAGWLLPISVIAPSLNHRIDHPAEHPLSGVATSRDACAEPNRELRLTPALLQGGGAVDRGQARGGLVGHELDAGVEEVVTGRRLRLGAGVGELLHRLDA